MSSKTQLEIKGNLSEHSLAELLVETTEANLSGSFRISNDDHKAIIYLNQGDIVFAVSNLRQHRLFSLALEENKLTQEQIASYKNVANDMEFGNKLVSENLISRNELTELTVKQIEEIIKFCLDWKSGEWVFSSLARVKEGIHFKIDLYSILLEFSRNLATDHILERFKSDEEAFGIKPSSPFHLNLQTQEAFVLSRFENEFSSLGEIDTLSGLPVNVTRHILYNLWLGGFLFRRNWNSVLSENKISEMLSAKLRIVKENEPVKQETPAPLPEVNIEIKDVPEEELSEETLLELYLARVENASNLYEVIGLETEAEVTEIKKAYFAQAKKYHPDLFHKNEEFHLRVQNAFTQLAQAYETLKTSESRDLYNYKMRKELAELKNREASGVTQEEVNINKQAEQAAQNFDWGMNLLQENEFEEAAPFFARAIHFDSNNARYHAFFGKALSFDRKNLHKAEGEIQIAIKLEPQNTNFRLMLAELFVHIGLKKRAEGELNRLLAIAPDDFDARTLLDSLQKK